MAVAIRLASTALGSQAIAASFPAEHRIQPRLLRPIPSRPSALPVFDDEKYVSRVPQLTFLRTPALALEPDFQFLRDIRMLLRISQAAISGDYIGLKVDELPLGRFILSQGWSIIDQCER